MATLPLTMLLSDEFAY